MSKFNSPLFHKPSTFHPSLLIPTPPESHTDTITANNLAISQDPSHGFEKTSPGLRKPSSIPYHNSSLRDNREKAQRTGKLLIIVTPPPTLLYDHGHTPSLNGSFRRLSEGVAMPLFPSMITQLAAIAREFSFPSTSGLCLYFHHVEDGLTVKPRISDDSWPSIWSYFSDPLSRNEPQPLFSGRVEFDIDLRLARWYPSWLSSIHRELSQYHGQSTGPLSTHSHFRGESQDTLREGRSFDFDVAEDSFTQPPEPNHRLLPRKLSLAERFDLVPARAEVSQPAFPSPDVWQSAGFRVLSTIVQEEEPKASSDTLDTRVKSWRESSLMNSNSLIATEKTSLDPANLPTTPINSELPLASAELKIEDFSWSISSAGPKSYDNSSPVSEVHVPSVHLASRLAGTVCSTPSVCTSFGPDSLDSISPISRGRAPSVHLTSRLAGSACTTPSTCTSFGPRDDTPFSPLLDIYRVPTPDLAHRLHGSVPSTPQTATTWGAPLSYPPSPRSLSISPSLDLGERSISAELELSLPSFLFHGLSRTAVAHDIGTTNSIFGYPYLKIYNPIYPYLEIYPVIPGAVSFSCQSTPVPSSNCALDIHVIPPVYPSFNLYPAVYPFNLRQIYPSILISTTAVPDPVTDSPPEIKVEFKTPCIYPSFCLYPAVYPFNLQQIYPSILTSTTAITQETPDPVTDSPPEIKVEFKTPCIYPSFCLYPAVYPFNLQQIYPSILTSTTAITQEAPDRVAHSPPEIKVEFKDPCVYPSFCLYPAVYPFNLQQIYPSVPFSTTAITQEAPDPVTDSPPEIKVEIKTPCVYPSFCLSDPVEYPSNLEELYPAIVSQSHPVELSEGYPHFNIYPPLSSALYAHLARYNSHPLLQYPEFHIYHDLPVLSCPAVQDVASQIDVVQSIHLRKYPIFNIYPAVYPFFDLYPAIEKCEQAHVPVYGASFKSSLSTTVESVYPFFNIYPPVYPHLEIYPVRQATAYQSASEQGTETTSTSILYIQENLEQDLTFDRDFSTSSRLRNTFPFFNLYPALYPHFDLYPAPGGGDVLLQPTPPKLRRSSSLVSNTAEPIYPTFNLYPAVYPYFDLYLPLPKLEAREPPSRSNKRSSCRLTHSELHAMVMMVMNEPARLFGRMEGMEGFEGARLGLDVHRYPGHSNPSKIYKTPSLSPLRDIFGELIERRTPMPPQGKVVNLWEPDSPSGPWPGKPDGIVWQRIKAFESSGVLT